MLPTKPLQRNDLNVLSFVAETPKGFKIRSQTLRNALDLNRMERRDYGIDTDNNGVPDGNYLTTAATVSDWANVVAMRINVLARNLESTNGYTDAKTYDMGVGGNSTPGGSYKRHVYNSVIRLVNPESRKEL